jgi:hypothetical protein
LLNFKLDDTAVAVNIDLDIQTQIAHSLLAVDNPDVIPGMRELSAAVLYKKYNTAIPAAQY